MEEDEEVTHIRGKLRPTNDPAVLAACLPAELLEGDWYGVLSAVRGWLGAQGSDTDMAREVLDLTGYDAVASLREWLEEP